MPIMGERGQREKGMLEKEEKKWKGRAKILFFCFVQRIVQCTSSSSPTNEDVDAVMRSGPHRKS